MGLLSAPAALICIQPRARPTHEISSTNRVKESVISPVEPCPLDSHKNRSRERKGKGREKKEQRTTPSSPIEKVFIAVGRKKGRALNLKLHYRNVVPIIRSTVISFHYYLITRLVSRIFERFAKIFRLILRTNSLNY